MDTIVVDQEYFRGDKRYFNPKHFPILAAIFSFLLPGILFSINIGTSEGKAKRNLYLLYFSVGAFIFWAFAFFFDGYISHYLGQYSKYIYEGINILIGYQLYIKQKGCYLSWLNYCQKPRSVLVPILLSVIPIGVILYFFLTNPISMSNTYEFSSNTISYASSVSKNQVIVLADRLLESGAVDSTSQLNLYITENKEYYKLLFPVKKEYVDSEYFNIYRDSMEQVINPLTGFNKRIEIFQADNYFKVVGSN